MMFIPWFEVPHVNGDTTHLAALAVTVINEDVKNRLTEIYSGTDLTVKTRLSVDEVFERMSAAIEGAHNAEMEALMPTATLAEAKGSWEKNRLRSEEDPQVQGRYPSGAGIISPEQARIDLGYGEPPVEPIPPWAD